MNAVAAAWAITAALLVVAVGAWVHGWAMGYNARLREEKALHRSHFVAACARASARQQADTEATFAAIVAREWGVTDTTRRRIVGEAQPYPDVDDDLGGLA